VSIQPTEFPGRSDRTIPVARVVPLAAMPSAGDFLARDRAICDNRTAVQPLLDSSDLPRLVVLPLPERVHITVADVDDIGRWMHERGGTLHVSGEFEGVQSWVLTTCTDRRADGSVVEIRVSCSVPVDASVLPEVRAAVTR
jgi:hypothetical protein